MLIGDATLSVQTMRKLGLKLEPEVGDDSWAVQSATDTPRVTVRPSRCGWSGTIRTSLRGRDARQIAGQPAIPRMDAPIAPSSSPHPKVRSLGQCLRASIRGDAAWLF
jgi:hypothetical protein